MPRYTHISLRNALEIANEDLEMIGSTAKLELERAGNYSSIDVISGGKARNLFLGTPRECEKELNTYLNSVTLNSGWYKKCAEKTA